MNVIPGLTVLDVAQRYRVSPDKVRTWIKRGELAAINTAAKICGKPRWVITPDALVRQTPFRSSGTEAKPTTTTARTVRFLPGRMDEKSERSQHACQSREIRTNAKGG